MSVVSLNNTLMSEMKSPPLTTVDVNIYQLGYEAAKYLVDKIEHSSAAAKCIITPHKIVKCQTCSRV